MMELIKIPVERVKILLGEDNSTKKDIEKKCDVKLIVNKDGEVEITGNTTEVYFAKDVVKAVGRGFQPKDALRLITENTCFFLIDLKDYLSNNKAIKRIKGRIIGENGKIKKEIESATESIISVFGDTVGIIANIDTIEYAKDAIFKIIDGAEHSSVYNYLGKVRRQIVGERLR